MDIVREVGISAIDYMEFEATIGSTTFYLCEFRQVN